jgi:hypothetical protein
MAYTDFRGLATVLFNGPPIRGTTTAAVKVGDLLDRLFALADASAAALPAKWVALEDGASGDLISIAKWAVIRKPTTVGGGGATTVGSHSGTLGDMLWLSTTAGKAVEVIDGDGIYQVVGHVLSTQDVYLEPSFAPGDFFEDAEKETGARTAVLADSGKVLVCTSTSDIVVTLTATAAQGSFTIINGAQKGDHLTSITPVSADGIAGWDFSNSDDGDATNTKATSQPGDYLTVISGGLAGGFYVVAGRGVWAGA